MKRQSSYKERRSHARAPLSLRFHLRDNLTLKVWQAVSRDVSPLGIQVEMEPLIPITPKMIVELWPEDSVLCDHVVRAEVRWVMALDRKKSLCGVAFADKNDWSVPVSTICRSLLPTPRFCRMLCSVLVHPG